MISLLSDIDRAVVSVTINEEEHQDSGKKKVDTNILEHYGPYNGLLYGIGHTRFGDYRPKCYSDFCTDIDLPPPERNV